MQHLPESDGRRDYLKHQLSAVTQRTLSLIYCLPTPHNRSRLPNSDQNKTTSPFVYGAIVLVTLNSPREKFWGAVLDVSAAGLSIRGVDLNSFDEVIAMLRNDEHVTPATVFFPLNRVERIELEITNGPIPSLSDRFVSKSGREINTFLGVGGESA